MYYTFYKQDEGDKVWWVEAVAEKPEGPYEPMIGDMEFSFDRKMNIGSIFSKIILKTK